MLLKILILFIMPFYLYASNALNEHYYVPTDKIQLSTLIPDVKSDILLYTITQGRYTRRVKSKELISTLKAHGYKDYVSKSNYIKFTKRSPINTTKIKEALKKIYTQKYKEINITNIEVNPRGYLKAIPSQ